MGHCLMLATITVPEGTSQAARQLVYDTLMADDSFIEPGMSKALFFYDPITDFFSIGGAWSGYLVGGECSSDNELGEDNDAQLITKELFDTYLSLYIGESVHNSHQLEFVDLDNEAVSSSFIGRKHIVIVDFHQ